MYLHQNLIWSSLIKIFKPHFRFPEKIVNCKLSNGNFFITYNFFPLLHINLALSLQALFSKSCLNRIKSSAENLKRRGSLCYHLCNPMQNFLCIKMCLSQYNHSSKISPDFHKICQICFGHLVWKGITSQLFKIDFKNQGTIVQF